MNETLHIENVVLGAGEAGKYLAWDLAQQGRPRRRDRARFDWRIK